MTPEIQQAIVRECNGLNQHDLARKYQISLQQVYNCLRDNKTQQKRKQFTAAVATFSANPHIYQSLPAYLHELVILEAHRLQATDALSIIAQLTVNCSTTDASGSADHQTLKTSLNQAKSLRPQAAAQRLKQAVRHYLSCICRGFQSLFLSH